MLIGTYEHHVIKKNHGEYMDEWCRRVCEELHGEEDKSWVSYGIYVMFLKDGRMVTSM